MLNIWSAIFFFCIITWPGFVLAQNTETFVSRVNAPGTDVVIVFEHHLIERKSESVAGKRLAVEFAKRIESVGFRKTKKSEAVVVKSAYCEVILRDWVLGEPNFKIACLSIGQLVPYERLPETLDEVLAELNTWFVEHKKRLARPKPVMPPVPEPPSLLYEFVPQPPPLPRT